MDMTKFGERVRVRRRELKITQADLAEKLETSVGYIGHMERGRRTPSLDMLMALCKVLQVTPNYLLQDYITGEPEEYPDEEITPEVIRAAKNFITVYETSQQSY
ncbi:MAG: helix-turn-helix domain-containing protein [Candidatus Spyradocola sp.]